jgi:hypothetical protein
MLPTFVPNADGLRSAVVHICLVVEAASIDDLAARFRALAEPDLQAGAIARRTTSSSEIL